MTDTFIGIHFIDPLNMLLDLIMTFTFTHSVD